MPFSIVGPETGTILAPTAESPLASAMYADLLDDLALAPRGGVYEQINSIDDYVAAPPFIAVPTADGSAWWLLLNRDLSIRNWC